MSKITKEQVLANLDEVKQFIQEVERKKEEKVVCVAIKNRFTGSIIFQSTKTTYKEAVEEANLSGANLSGADLNEADLSGADLNEADLSEADLRGANLNEADLSEAEMQNAKFFGRGGTQRLKSSQLPDFVAALGFLIEE